MQGAWLSANLAQRDPSSPERSPLSTSSSIHHKPSRPDLDSDDSDALLEELEEELDNDFDLGGFREQRMRELQAQCVPSLRRPLSSPSS
mgnify:CR=1 FL=1